MAAVNALRPQALPFGVQGGKPSKKMDVNTLRAHCLSFDANPEEIATIPEWIAIDEPKHHVKGRKNLMAGAGAGAGAAWILQDDTKEAHMKEMAEFAVAKFNEGIEDEENKLVLAKVLKGWTRVIDTGTLYKIILTAKGVIVTKYQTLVHDDGDEKTLVYFKPIN